MCSMASKVQTSETEQNPQSYISKHISITIIFTLTIFIIFISISSYFCPLNSTYIQLSEAISSVAMSIIAVYGLSAWKFQENWKMKKTSLVEFLKIFHHACDAINDITDPFILIDQEDRNNAEAMKDIVEAIVIEKKKVNESHQDIFSTLYAKKYEFKYTLGEEFEEIFDQLLKYRRIIITNLSTYAHINSRLNKYKKDIDDNVQNTTIGDKPLKEIYAERVSKLEHDNQEIEHVIFGHPDSSVASGLKRLEAQVRTLYSSHR